MSVNSRACVTRSGADFSHLHDETISITRYPLLTHRPITRAPQRLTRADFALYRGWLDGLPLAQLHAAYSPHADLRATRAHLAYLRDALSVAARRAQDPAAAHLLRIKPGSLKLDEVHGRDDVPTLDTYREQIDPEGVYSEAELLEFYGAEFPTLADARLDRRLARNRRLRERQAEALARLEAALADLPKRDHPLDSWFEPALAHRLAAAGLTTVNDLLAHVERHRHRWYAQVPRVGPTAAVRVMDWISRNAPSLGYQPSVLATTPRRQLPRDHGALRRPPATGVVPLEAIEAPPELDGSSGSNRAPDRCRLPGVNTDKAAILAWLETRANAHTFRAYRREAERILLWATIGRGKAFSSITAADALDYIRSFLTDPQPTGTWVRRRRVERFDADWRPFDGPLEERSREAARAILLAMCRWLVEQRYLAVNPFSGIGRIRPGRPLARDASAMTQQQLRCHLENLASRPTLRGKRDRCALLLAYQLGLSPAELAAATVGHLVCRADGSAVPNWQLEVVGRRGVRRIVWLTRDFVDALRDYFQARGLPGDFAACPPQSPVVLPMRGAGPLTAHGVSHLLKTALLTRPGELRQ